MPVKNGNKYSSPDKWLVGAVVVQVAAVIIAVLFCLSFLAGGDQMTSWIGGMIDNIAQDARQTKSVQFDMWKSNKERDYFTSDRGANWLREDTAIARRVADARAAGVHPLFALGAQIQPSPAQYIPAGGGISGGGGGASMDIPDAMSVETHRAALGESAARTRLMNAQADDLVAQSAKASQEARDRQNANVQQDKIKLMADQMTSAQSRDPSVSAGRDHPAYREYVVTQWGLKMDLPYSEEGPSEALENVPFYLWPAIVQHNRAKYGDDWGTRFYQEFVLGKAPIYRPYPKRSAPGSGRGYSSSW